MPDVGRSVKDVTFIPAVATVTGDDQFFPDLNCLWISKPVSLFDRSLQDTTTPPLPFSAEGVEGVAGMDKDWITTDIDAVFLRPSESVTVAVIV